MNATEIIRAAPVQPARPWPRHTLTSQAWRSMARALTATAELRFEALWADETEVFALFTRPELAGLDPLLVSAPVEAGMYAALSPAQPAASLFERAIADLWGHVAAHALDARPSLDHGAWPVLRPMLPRPVPNAGAADPPEPLAAPDDATILQRGPIGPAGPALLTLAARGERLLQVEARLGYAHRGVLALLRGRTPGEAAPLIARLSAAGTVAHSLAFARAVEAAAGADPPPRAIALRALAADLERLAIHLHDLADMLDAAGYAAAAMIDQREALLRAFHLGFGHRLLMDVVVPGGVARDIAPEGAATLVAALEALAPPALRGLARRTPAAVERHLRALRQAVETALDRLRSLPGGALLAALPAPSGEGLGRGEGARGVHWHWLQLRDGRVGEAFARDPAWLLWPGFEGAAAGMRIGDLELLAASLGLSVNGVDL